MTHVNNSTQATSRIRTGIPGLDTILDGGFLRHNSVLLKGAPGTGKTSLGIQILLQGIEENEGGIICSFEQFPQQLRRDTEAFGWELDRLVDEKKLVMLFLQPEDLAAPKGAAASPLVSRIAQIAEEIGARRLLLDSISHFNRLSADPVECRSVLLHFINEIKSLGITPILTAELHHAGDREFSFEEYLVDEVVLIHNELASSAASLPQRSIEVTKTRGHAHVRGRHPVRFVDSGLEVYPHILPEPFLADETAGADLEPVPSGITGIDEMLGGGYPKAGATILAGMSGAYKTTLAGAFLAEGARRGEKGLFLTFEETPARLVGMLARRGIDLGDAVRNGTVVIRHHVPKQSSLDEIFAHLHEDLDQGGLRRVVIDSLEDFERSIHTPAAYKDYLGMFLAALTRHSATALLTEKLENISGANPITDIRYVSMVDTVIYLGNVEIESRIHKVISILKSRGARADADLREIDCDERGPRVGEKFHGMSGILQGVAHGQYKQTVEDIFQPLYFIRDFARIAAGEQVADTQRRTVLADILKQTGSLEAALKDHFGFDPETEKAR
ncbi:hypothetical protein HQ520_14345 [bacterium]|nr:hypothetical protein [bacterium]